MNEYDLEPILIEFAQMMHHNWQHPTWEYGSDRDPCPFMFDWHRHDDKFSPVIEETLDQIKGVFD